MKQRIDSYFPGIIPALALFCALPAAAFASELLSVEQAIRIGLQNNYTIGIARHDAEIAANNKGKGTANFLPRLDASGSFRYDAVNRDTGSPSSFGNYDTRTWASELQLNWTLFDGFRMFADRRRYDELALAGSSAARDRIEATVVAIMQSFFNLVQQEQLLDVARDTRDVSRTRLERETVRNDLGGASTTDLLNARVNFNIDQSDLLDRELAVTVARKELNILLARDPLERIAVKKEITIPPLQQSFDDILAEARRRNSALRTARHNLRAAQESVRIAQSSFWPRLDLATGYGYSDRALLGGDVGQQADRTDRSINASAGLVLSFNLFNGNIDSINLQNARLEALNSELALRDTENEIAGLVRETHATFLKRLEKLHLEEQNLETAARNLDLQKERYAVGASDSLDFRDAQVKFAEAQVRLIVARYDARISLLELHRLTGSIEID